jgi:hypothetical protein
VRKLHDGNDEQFDDMINAVGGQQIALPTPNPFKLEIDFDLQFGRPFPDECNYQKNEQH